MYLKKSIMCDFRGRMCIMADGKLEEKYIVDVNGERIGVVLDIRRYTEMLEDLEELESIRACDAAKASGDEAIPFDQAAREIEKSRS
jgi:hypothetical protein